MKILQKLCEDDIHHLNRIREYIKGGSAPGETSENETKKILIVINDASVAKLLRTILEPEGQIDIAGNGRDGLQKVKDQNYSLIVSAIEMPIVNGIKFYNEAKGLYPDLHKRFLFFTGAPTSERLSFFEDEDLKYLTKPATINEIRAAALSILGERQ